MLAHLADVSLRSLLLAFAAGALLWMLRGKRTAALQHAVWTAVVCGMLALFAFGAALPRLPVRVLRERVTTTPAAPPFAVAAPLSLLSIDDAPAAVRSPVALHRSIDWGSSVLYAYAAITLAFLGRFLTGMVLVRRLLTKSAPGGPGFRESAIVKVPLTIGVLRRQILLPLEWREWDSAKLNAVLAHEGAHVRRRDGLVAALAGINRCIFWFHPLAWWLERKLSLLAEFACDESCIATLGDAEEYARLLLEMALVVDRSQGRLRKHALTMAAGSHIRQRIDSILKEGRAFSPGLSVTTWAAIAACGIPLLLGAGSMTLEREVPSLPLLPLQRSPFVPFGPTPPPPPHALLAQAQVRPASPPKSEARVKFEVASIRPAAPSGPPQPGTALGSGGNAPPPPPPPPGGGSGCFGRRNVDAGRVDWSCVSLRDLLLSVFAIPRSRLVGPDWIDSQQFDILAKLPEGASRDQIPAMFQALLEDRFGLAFHRESKDGSLNALVIAKGGLKLKPAAPQSAQPAWVAAAAAAAASEPPYGDGYIAGVQFRSISIPGPDGAPMVILHSPVMGFVRRSNTGGPGGIIHYEAPDITPEGLAALAVMGGNGLDPGVVDMTGLSGRYQVTLDVSMTDLIATITAGPRDEGTMQKAQISVVQDGLKKLGLQLEPRKGPFEVVVIDHIERNPTPN